MNYIKFCLLSLIVFTVSCSSNKPNFNSSFWTVVDSYDTTSKVYENNDITIFEFKKDSLFLFSTNHNFHTDRYRYEILKDSIFIMICNSDIVTAMGVNCLKSKFVIRYVDSDSMVFEYYTGFIDLETKELEYMYNSTNSCKRLKDKDVYNKLFDAVSNQTFKKLEEDDSALDSSHIGTDNVLNNQNKSNFNLRDLEVQTENYAFVVLKVKEGNERLFGEKPKIKYYVSSIQEFEDLTEDDEYHFMDLIQQEYTSRNGIWGHVVSRNIYKFETYKEASKSREKFTISN